MSILQREGVRKYSGSTAVLEEKKESYGISYDQFHLVRLSLSIIYYTVAESIQAGKLGSSAH